MNEDGTETIVNEEDEPFLPDGWTEDKDFFTFADEDASVTTDGQAQESTSQTDTGDEQTDDRSALTTGSEGQTEVSNAGADTDTEPADGQSKPTEPTSRILKLKVNHEEEDFDVNSASDEDLTAMLQKARAFDRMKNDQAKQQYRDTFNALIDSGMPEAIAKLGAKEQAGGKEFSLTDEEPETPPAEKSEPAQPQRDFKADLNKLQSLRPDITQMPQEVMNAYANGADLLSAYLLYENGQSRKAAASLQKENEVLKQNAASAARAPVKGVTGGGASAKQEKDPGLIGFDKDW